MDMNDASADKTNEDGGGNSREFIANYPEKPIAELGTRLDDETVFSKRRAEVYVLVRRGFDDTDIAEKLGIAESTVVEHRRQLSRLVEQSRATVALAAATPDHEATAESEEEHDGEGETDFEGPPLDPSQWTAEEIAERTVLSERQAAVYVLNREYESKVRAGDRPDKNAVKTIAEELDLSRWTVYDHRDSIDDRMARAQNTLDLIALDDISFPLTG